jgi:single-strand DNA-binding protein
MARENTITLVGEVSSPITVALNKVHSTYRVSFNVKTLRRNGRTDFPRVNVFGLTEEQARKIFNEFKIGEYVMVRGMISTKMAKKVIKCEGCGKEYESDALVTEVIAYSMPAHLNGEYEANELKEFANNLHMIGAVCSEVQSRISQSGVSMTQYQVAVNRKYHVKEKEDKTDFPWVKTFGRQAEEDEKDLKVSSQIYINGAIQTREVSKTIVCDECESVIKYVENLGEIVPQDVEYLNNCVFDEDPSPND